VDPTPARLELTPFNPMERIGTVSCGRAGPARNARLLNRRGAASSGREVGPGDPKLER
jgi:hypothetical protein